MTQTANANANEQNDRMFYICTPILCSAELKLGMLREYSCNAVHNVQTSSLELYTTQIMAHDR